MGRDVAMAKASDRLSGAARPGVPRHCSLLCKRTTTLGHDLMKGAGAPRRWALAQVHRLPRCHLYTWAASVQARRQRQGLILLFDALKNVCASCN